MRLLTGFLTALLLTLGLVPAGSARAAAAPDPAVVAASHAVLEAAFNGDWRTLGGTYRSECTGGTRAAGSSDWQTHEYNPKTGTFRYRSFGASYGEQWPSTFVEHNGRRYNKVVKAVRESMRVHRTRAPQKWMKASGKNYANYSLFGDDGPPRPDWVELTSTPQPDGGVRYDGTERFGGGIEQRWVLWVAPDGRLTRYERSVEGEQGYVCVGTFDWSRPAITVPKKAPVWGTRGYPTQRRYFHELGGLDAAGELTRDVQQRIASGVTEAEAVAYLHGLVPKKQRLTHGIRFIYRRAKVTRTRPALPFVVKVRDQNASYRPVR